jgi:hypothetical protein
MKDQNPSEQSSAAAQRREQLDAFLSYVQDHAQDILSDPGELLPTLCVLQEEGLAVYTANSKEEAQDDSHAEDVRLICCALGARLAVLALQVWARVAKPGEPLGLQPYPSLFSDRKEYISLIGAAPGDIHAHRLLPVLRDRDGRFSGLGTSALMAAKPVVGRYANLFPQSPPSAEDRELARRLLACRGLVIHAGPLPE